MNKVAIIVSIIAVASLDFAVLAGAYVQSVTIRTSADSLGRTFFGEGVLQVVVTDPEADSDSNIEDISVKIDADPNTGSTGSSTFIVPETSASSGKFELFLAHEDSSISPGDLDPINSAGVEGDGSCVSDCSPFITFGAGGDLVVDADLYEDVGFEIAVGDTKVTIEYEGTASTVELDRSSYGSDSFVYITIFDQDANLNPFASDEFTVDPASGPNADLLQVDGASLDGIVVFSETGDDSARFEGRYHLGESITASSDSVVLTLFDKANYNANLSAAENDSHETDEVSFTIGDTDGSLGLGGEPIVTWDPELSADKTSLMLGQSVKVTVKDPDANADTTRAESISLELASLTASAEVAGQETGTNTGIFEVNIVVDSTGLVVGTTIELDEGSVLQVTYTDKRPADYSEKLNAGENPEMDFTVEINVAASANIGINSTTASPPVAKSVLGSFGSHTLGTQLVLSTTVENNNDIDQPFVAIIEVRDASSITVFLAWQSGMLDPRGSSDIRASWTPEASGQYEIRTFVISSLDSGEVLSPIVTSKTSVI